MSNTNLETGVTPTMTANNAAVNSLNNGNTGEKPVAKSKKSRNPFLGTLGKARNVFKKQIDRNAKTKRSAVLHVLKLSDKDQNLDKEVFLADFHDLFQNRLLDSMRFNRDCKSLGLNAFIVAQHVAFDGYKRLDEVLKIGLEEVYKNELIKMTEPIFTLEELTEAKLKPRETQTEEIVESSESTIDEAA